MPTSSSIKVGIIGGGVGGTTTAIRLAEQGTNVYLFEKSDSLVNGPPFCHLHAGGNMYREISEDQCVQLLRECIRTVRLFPHVINERPTCIAIPTRDPGSPNGIMKRLEMLKALYTKLVNLDEKNQVLGNPRDYFSIYSKEECLKLSKEPLPDRPSTLDDWLIPVVKYVDLEKLKFPLVMVNEFGWSIPRQAASAMVALSNLPSASVLVNTEVTNVEAIGDGFRISFNNNHLDVDYLINACGHKTGSIDDFIEVKTNRLVEFKASYLCQWNQPGLWPEIVFHGPRGTPIGMAQYTPYADGLVQLHGMTEEITLFQEGLIKSTEESSQPSLGNDFENKINFGWSRSETFIRTEQNIRHMRNFIPTFNATPVESQPLFGAQQIPGKDATLRAASVTFANERYARIDIVKASSAISAADAIQDNISQQFNLQNASEVGPIDHLCPITAGLDKEEVILRAETICTIRDIPPSLALYYDCDTKHM